MKGNEKEAYEGCESHQSDGGETPVKEKVWVETT